MFLTCANLAKKAKADRVVVLCKSLATGHGRYTGTGEYCDNWSPYHLIT